MSRQISRVPRLAAVPLAGLLALASALHAQERAATPRAAATPEAAASPAASGTPQAVPSPSPAAGSGLTGSGPTQTAQAVLLDAQGQPVGTATLTEQLSHVTLRVEVRNMTPGEHGIHVHGVGACDPPDFSSAGGHHAPMQMKHGMQNPAGHHAGDLPNLVVDEDGTGTLEFTTDRFTLTEGPWSLFDKDGSAVVVHAKPDDYKTDPAGNSGDRVACGIVKVGGSGRGSAARPAPAAGGQQGTPTPPADRTPAP
jgi:Cu-Zn family superoxide dismutase